jgi:hypothetical protein
MKNKTCLKSLGAAVAFGALTLAGTAYSQTAPAEPPKAPQSWVDGITFGAWVEAGSTYNLSSGAKKNFGRLFDDRNRQFQLNQVALTVQRKIDSSVEGYDFGFKLQGMYGSDARYTHFLHEFQNVTGDSFNQFDIVEANVQAHTPWVWGGGIDFKIGQYPTLEGAETIDPTTNFLYSHSYIFNFGIPFKHTGVMTVSHVLPWIDVYAGADSGVNTSLGDGNNNDGWAFHGGLGFTFLDGNLTSLATTHIGPENPSKSSNGTTLPLGADKKNRYLNDITTTWKVTDKLTLINDLNYVQDDCGLSGSGDASTCHTVRGYGVAQYAVYVVNDMISLVARGEVWRDEEGAFVIQINNNLDFVRLENGDPPRATVQGGGRTTYMGLTGGVNIKPTLDIPYLQSLTIRPEIRYDNALNNTTPFANGTKHDQTTIAADVILQF